MRHTWRSVIETYWGKRSVIILVIVAWSLQAGVYWFVTQPAAVQADKRPSPLFGGNLNSQERLDYLKSLRERIDEEMLKNDAYRFVYSENGASRGLDADNEVTR